MSNHTESIPSIDCQGWPERQFWCYFKYKTLSESLQVPFCASLLVIFAVTIFWAVAILDFFWTRFKDSVWDWYGEKGKAFLSKLTHVLHCTCRWFPEIFYSYKFPLLRNNSGCQSLKGCLLLVMEWAVFKQLLWTLDTLEVCLRTVIPVRPSLFLFLPGRTIGSVSPHKKRDFSGRWQGPCPLFLLRKPHPATVSLTCSPLFFFTQDFFFLSMKSVGIQFRSGYLAAGYAGPAGTKT